MIRVIRSSATQAEAKARLMGIEAPAAMMQRALGDEGFAVFQQERGVRETYTLTAVQADAILRMTLGQLVNLEQEKLGGEHHKLLEEITEYLRILSDDKNILGDDPRAIAGAKAQARRRAAHRDQRRRDRRSIDLEDLITEETMVVTISHNGYIKRTPASVYRAQRRGGKGMKGAKTEEEDPIQHLFVASTHDYLLFFTNRGKVYWQKVYDLPQLSRESRGRAVVNLLNFAEGEKIADCRTCAISTQPDHYLMMATRERAGEEDRARSLQPADARRHHRHQAPRRRRAGRRRDHQAGRRSGAGHRPRHGDPLSADRRPADGPQHQRREGHSAAPKAIAWWAWSWPIPKRRC